MHLVISDRIDRIVPPDALTLRTLRERLLGDRFAVLKRLRRSAKPNTGFALELSPRSRGKDFLLLTPCRITVRAHLASDQCHPQAPPHMEKHGAPGVLYPVLSILDHLTLARLLAIARRVGVSANAIFDV